MWVSLVHSDYAPFTNPHLANNQHFVKVLVSIVPVCHPRDLDNLPAAWAEAASVTSDAWIEAEVSKSTKVVDHEGSKLFEGSKLSNENSRTKFIPMTGRKSPHSSRAAPPRGFP
jgi:hypothetical protein